MGMGQIIGGKDPSNVLSFFQPKERAQHIDGITWFWPLSASGMNTLMQVQG